MVTAKTQFNLSNAKEYFEEHLSVGDYYAEGQKIAGEWFGDGATRLGLSGRVQAAEFLALCDNLHPQTGERLTQRQKGSRWEADGLRPNRRIFYDFTFSPPKSVSILALAGGDNRIIEAHHDALRIALSEFEPFAATRLRRHNANGHRLTSNVVAAMFTHDTSRALDPHLHTHCIAFNATFDDTERRWKALQNYEMLRARKFVENVYYHELARSLRSFGYQIRNHARGDFEIEGVSRELHERFSKRHEQIDDALKTLLAGEPELAAGNLKKLREQLAVTSRAKKVRDVGRVELKSLWNAQLTLTEKTRLAELTAQISPPAEPASEAAAQEALQWAEQHLFDRSAVVPEHELWRFALERGRGQPIDVQSLKRLTGERGYICDSSEVRQVTTKEVLAREWEIVTAAKEGIGSYSTLASKFMLANPELDIEQKAALERLLKSRDFVTLFRGGAGTGKSFVLRELVSHLETADRTVRVIAPQRQQVVDLASAGFPRPTTVADFVLREPMQEGDIVLVDEAGQIGGRQMLELVQLVRSRNGRLVLSGDTRQHGPVEVSDAMAALEKYAGLKPAELSAIKRQNPAQARTEPERETILEYRRAVEAAAHRRLKESFIRLDSMGAVIECRPDEQQGRLADEYVRLAESGDSVVVISQTWSEVHRVNEQVRSALKTKRLLGESEWQVEALEKLDLTNAQKRDERYYSEGCAIVFNQPVHGAAPGTKAKYVAATNQGIVLESGEKVFTVLNRHLEKISVCQPLKVALSPGDRLQLKANRRMTSGALITNGELVTVESVRPDGAIELADGRLLETGYREFVPGYAVTSYGSQGKTVDYVLFSDSAIKVATNDQQWYVTISRGRKGIRIFTPEKAQLRENVLRAGNRPLALDLAAAAPPFSHRINSPNWVSRLLAFARRARLFNEFNLSQKEQHERQNSRMLGH